MSTLTTHQWSLFPCRPQGKEPWGKYAPHGHNSASANPDMWVDVPANANWGINCAKSGLVVVDVDSGPIPDFCPPTYTVKTGRGWHLYYLAEEGVTYRGTLGEGIDVKHNGYVIAAGSRHPDGHLYELVDSREPVALTDDLRKRLHAQTQTAHHARSSRIVRGGAKHRVRVPQSKSNAVTRLRVWTYSALAGLDDSELDENERTLAHEALSAVTQGGPRMETTHLVKAAKGAKIHTGFIVRGAVTEMSYCNRTLKDPVLVATVEREGYGEADKWVKANYPHDQLCKACFYL